jgi:hypothetical protein
MNGRDNKSPQKAPPQSRSGATLHPQGFGVRRPGASSASVCRPPHDRRESRPGAGRRASS